VAQRSLVELIRSFHADAVVNINSRLFYEAMVSFGPALAASERLFSVFFCGEQTPRGNWVGYPFRNFYRTVDQLTGVITDSAHWRDWFLDTYQVGPSTAARMHVFDAPVDRSLPVVEPRPRPSGRRPRVYWAGRWDRQKRIDLVRAIARRMPDVDFLMWGEPVLGGDSPARMPDNVHVQGRYGHISELDLADADAWLYTSAWDGVPSQLLEVGLTGVPVVASDVGGTSEVLSPDDGWLVPGDAGPEAYEEALRDVLADPVEAGRRARALRERLLRERSERAFAAQVTTVLLPEQRRKEVGA
jgi:glycosyltransferase involved in cell wall biosynthesis